VVIFRLGDVGDTLKEIDRGHEVFHPPLAANRLSILDQSPMRQSCQHAFNGPLVEWLDAPFARFAFLAQ
jgi:hypothetical protein